MVNSVFGSEDPEGLFLRTFLMGGIFLGMLYLGWILIAYVVLVQIFKASADLQSLMRTMGYAALLLSLSLLMFIPVLAPSSRSCRWACCSCSRSTRRKR